MIRDERLMSQIMRTMATADARDLSVRLIAASIGATEEATFNAISFLEERGIVRKQQTLVGRSGVYRLTDTGHTQAGGAPRPDADDEQAAS